MLINGSTLLQTNLSLIVLKQLGLMIEIRDITF